MDWLLLAHDDRPGVYSFSLDCENPLAVQGAITMFTHGDKALRCEIHHLQWQLQSATAKPDADPMLAWLGLNTEGRSPLLHYAER